MTGIIQRARLIQAALGFSAYSATMDNTLPAKPRLDRSVTGRKKGTPNKVTKLLKTCILQAAEEAGGGGKNGIVNYLKTQALENPGPFMGLLGKVLPSQIAAEGKDGEPLTVEIVQFHTFYEGVPDPAPMKLINPPE
jgi:hypothetical protein